MMTACRYRRGARGQQDHWYTKSSATDSIRP